MIHLDATLVALFAAVGTAIGSFVALVSQRLTAGGAIAMARSACAGCDAVLGPRDLVPLVSFAVLRGRCGRCSAAIPWR